MPVLILHVMLFGLIQTAFELFISMLLLLSVRNTWFLCYLV